MVIPPKPTAKPVQYAEGGNVPDLVTGTLVLDDGGVWTAGIIQVGVVSGGLNGFGGTATPGLIAVADSRTGTPTTLEVGTIDLGIDGSNPDAATPSVSGTLDITGGSRIDASGLSMVDASQVTIDAGSSMVLGSAAAQAGALVVGDGTTLSAITGNIFANVVLDGAIGESGFLLFLGDGGDRFQIDGTLTGDGTVEAGTRSIVNPDFAMTGAMFEIGDASGFTGTIDVVPDGLLVLDKGGAPDAALTMTNATVDLLADPYTGAAPTYDPATGRLIVGTATLDVGPATAAANFATRVDAFGGTLLIGQRLPTWQSAAGNPSGDWGDTAHWSTGDLPLSTDTVSIGPGITASAPWTITASDRVVLDLTLSMGLGTLAVSGGLDMNNALTLDSGTLIGTAGAQIGALTYEQSGGVLDASGGQIFTTYATMDGHASATLHDGGSWTASELGIGSDPRNAASDTLDVGGRGTLIVQDTLALGSFAFQPTTDAVGTLALTNGAVASARFVTLSPGSWLSVDGSSSLTVGDNGGTAGRGTILVTATLDVTGTATLAGNLLDQGVVNLGATSVGSAGLFAGATFAGSFSGTGVLAVNSNAEIADASGFAGMVEIQEFSTLTLLGGTAPVGAVVFGGEGYSEPAELDLRGVPLSGYDASYDADTGIVTVGTITLNVGANLQLADFVATGDGFGGTAISLVACFAAGTRIATLRGEVPVERLSVGDELRGPWGEAMPVRWLGHRRVDCARHPHPQDVWPVRVRAGAFRPGVPARDLRLSPDHAVFLAPPGVRPVLIPVRCLIDGLSVVQEAVARITYWHVELDRHAVLLAEGLPCESFLDVGNRAAFVNGGPAVDLHPDFAAARWRALACAPQVRGGPALDWARRWLAERRPAAGSDHALHHLLDDAG